MSSPLILLVLIASLVLVPLNAQAEAPKKATSRLLTDFTAASADLGWYVVNDNVMGGRSKGGFRTETGSLLFAGSTNTNGGGFSSIRTRGLRLDLSDYDGIRVRVKADGRTYTWRLTTDARWRGRPVSYWATFKTKANGWTDASVPFSAFKPQFRGRQLSGPALDPSRVRGMGLMIYDKRDGAFRLQLDSVHAYKTRAPFSLADYRSKRRVLVLFAPTTNDATLRTQLASIKSTRTAFADRDMELVIVLQDRGSFAKGTLSAREAATLRTAMGVKDGTFGLRLVGKDGTTKRADDRAVPMSDLYRLIDSMPMRRAEIRQRSS